MTILKAVIKVYNTMDNKFIKQTKRLYLAIKTSFIFHVKNNDLSNSINLIFEYNSLNNKYKLIFFRINSFLNNILV
jgi:hypothetical protein